MTVRFARFIAWSLVGIYFVLAGTGAVLMVFTNTIPWDDRIPVLPFVVIVFVIGLWSVIGALIIAHHPRHPVGWILIATFPLVAIDFFFIGYASYATLVHPSSPRIPQIMLLWLNWSAQPFVFVTFTLMNLSFPTGKLLSPRWRIVTWTVASALPAYLFLQTLEPGPIASFPSLINPYGVDRAAWAFLLPIYFAVIGIMTLCGFASVLSLFRRLKWTQGDERQQVKWLVFPAILYWISQPLAFLAEYDSNQIFLLISVVLVLISVPAIVIAVALAIFKYHLYDIDLIINRTLVYGALTACVVGLYVLIVGGAGLVIPTNPNLVGLLIATGLTGVLYRPMRAFFQRGADHVLPAALPVKEERNQDQSGTTNRAPEQKRREVQVWGRVLRPLWIVAAALSVAILFASLPGYLVRTPIGNLVFEPTPAMLVLHHFNSLISIFSAILSLSLAGLLFIKKFDERMGQFLSFYLLAYGILFAGPGELLAPFWPDAAWVVSFVLLPLLVGPGTVALIGLFPDGHFVPSWSRWLVPVSLVFLSTNWSIRKGAFFSDPAPLAWLFSALLTILSLGILLALVYIPIYRYRYISTPEQRQQTKWLVYGFCLLFMIIIISGIPWTIALNLPPGSLIPLWLPVVEFFWFLGTAILPVTLTISVMRYRLYEIDILINRTLFYGALSGTVIAIYVLVVGVMGTFMHAQGNLLITLFATGLIAVLFQPMREWLQRRVNRLIYGERDDPIGALSRLGKQMEVALPSDQVLPALVKTIAQTLKLPFVGITLKGQRDISFGQETENPVAFPFTFQGETTGVLLASPRNRGESFNSAEMRLLQNLARQAGASVRNAQLTADLQRSRQTIVTAREEERHRLRRDLHDGIGPTMAGLTLKLDAAKDLVSSGLESGKKEELEEAVQLLTELKAQTQETVWNIRDIVHTLRPPSLDVLGLVPALQAHVGQVAIPNRLKIQMRTSPHPPDFPRLSAAVEVAAYRIVLEAVTNVIHHAQAGNCEVSLMLGNGNLQMEIKDDGVGLPKVRPHGIGLDSMRERAEELGGRFELSSSPRGTRVCAEIPIVPTRNES